MICSVSEIEQAVNDMLESELTGLLGYDPYEWKWLKYGNSRNSAVE